MAKIGSQIRETRLRKGFTLDRVADDTNISVRFLAKIENDDFTGFPGELYVLGFMRNYAEYLGLDPEEIIRTYRMREEEQAPLPAKGAAADEPASVDAVSASAVSSASSPRSQAEVPASAEITNPEGEPKSEKVRKSLSVPRPRAKKPEVPAGAPSVAEGADVIPAAAPPEPPAGKPAAEKLAAEKPAAEKPATGRPVAKRPATEEPAGEPRGPAAPLPAKIAPRYLFAAATLVALAAAGWILFGTGTPDSGGGAAKEPVEYRIEGESFERRIYPGDILLVAVGADVYRFRLASIGDKASLETPFGPLELGLGSPGTVDVDKDGAYDLSLGAQDFEKNKPSLGVLLHLEYAPVETAAASDRDVTIPGDSPQPARAAPASQPPQAQETETVILRTTRGPYPLIVQVTFRGACLFRYEADRKEWVEKYYAKGETITVNMNSSLTVWASNAQAAKLSFQAGGSKPADLELGSPGEVVVKKIGWSKSGSSWTLTASDLD